MDINGKHYVSFVVFALQALKRITGLGAMEGDERGLGLTAAQCECVLPVDDAVNLEVEAGLCRVILMIELNLHKAAKRTDSNLIFALQLLSIQCLCVVVDDALGRLEPLFPVIF